jgi:predicted dinucleotide-binding enzyme
MSIGIIGAGALGSNAARLLAKRGISATIANSRGPQSLAGPGARVVKAFNHLDVRALPEPAVSGGQRVLFYSGDDVDAKAEVRKIIERTGYFPVDLGGLDVGGPLAGLPFGSLAAINFIKI